MNTSNGKRRRGTLVTGLIIAGAGLAFAVGIWAEREAKGMLDLAARLAGPAEAAPAKDEGTALFLPGTVEKSGCARVCSAPDLP